MCFAEDFWLGLKKIHSLTQQGVYIMRIDLEDWKEEKHWVEYRFSLEGPSMDYTLHVSHFSGDLPDAMANNTGRRFSTKDSKNDNHRNSNCARSYTGKQFYRLIQQKEDLYPHNGHKQNALGSIKTKQKKYFCNKQLVKTSI